jgi:hypothetical protein
MMTTIGETEKLKIGVTRTGTRIVTLLAADSALPLPVTCASPLWIVPNQHGLPQRWVMADQMGTEASIIPPIVPKRGCQKPESLVSEKWLQHTMNGLESESEHLARVPSLFPLLLRWWRVPLLVQQLPLVLPMY